MKKVEITGKRKSSFDRCVESWLWNEFETRPLEVIFSNKPYCLFTYLRRSAVELRAAKRRLKILANPKTGKPYARKTIENYKSDAKSWAETLAKNKALVKLGVAAGFIGNGPKNDFERVAGILLRLYIDSRAELTEVGLSSRDKFNRKVGALALLHTGLPVKLAAGDR